MNIPVIFAFDKNFLQSAAVTISSLLANSNKEQYTIICLHSSVSEKDLNWLLKLRDKYNNCEFRFVDMNDLLNSLFLDAHITNEHITRTAYFRLLIPDLFPEYEKIIYADVDMIFQRGLSEIWQEDVSGFYIGAVNDYYISHNSCHLAKIGVTGSDYINSGFMVINNNKLIEDKMVPRWLADLKNPVNSYPDQDIINKTCQGSIRLLPPIYNCATECFCRIPPYDYCCGKCEPPSFLSVSDWRESKKTWNLHYTGRKPWWKGRFLCYPKQKIWWHYYFKLPSGSPKKIVSFSLIWFMKFFYSFRSFLKWSIKRFECEITKMCTCINIGSRQQNPKI